MNIAASLDRQATDRADHPALVTQESSWSYAELDLRASRVATGLEGRGVEPGDRVAIVMGNQPEHVAAWYGIQKAGAVPVDVNIILGDEEWAYIFDSARPRAVLCGGEFADRLRALTADRETEVFAVGGEAPGSFEALGAGTERRDAVARDDGDLAVIAYTSGTTGLPKGVMHDHATLRLHLGVIEEALGYDGDDVIVNLLPLFPLHAFLTQAGIATHLGATLLLMGRFDPARLAELSREFEITAGTFVPAIVVALLQMPEEARPRFGPGSKFNIGGAPLHPETRDRFESTFQVTLLQGFGSTEVMGAVAMERADRRAPWGSCGQLMPGAEGKVRVVDDDGNDVPPGEVGEFAVHADRALMGYWENDELTKEAFLDGTWYRMGDIGRIDEEGFVYVLDRKKDMIIRGGFNIYCAEIERVLNEHDAVAETTVIGVPDERLGEVPKAYVVLVSGLEPGQALAAELREVAERRLGSLKVPEQIEFVAMEDLPRNAMGKVLKRELKRQLAEAADAG